MSRRNRLVKVVTAIAAFTLLATACGDDEEPAAPVVVDTSAIEAEAAAAQAQADAAQAAADDAAATAAEALAALEQAQAGR